MGKHYADFIDAKGRMAAFLDEESEKVSKKYDLKCYDLQSIFCLGSHEREEIVRIIIGYSKQCGQIVGLELEKLKAYIPSNDPHHMIFNGSEGNLTDFVRQGYLRMSIQSDKAIVYPTEDLLDKIGVSRCK